MKKHIAFLRPLLDVVRARRRALALRLAAVLETPALKRLGTAQKLAERLRRPPIKPIDTPTVLQMEGVECGAASLAIVLAHFGRWVALEELRIACGVSRDGSKASNIIKASLRYGLMPRALKTEPAGLRRIEPPMILHWNFNHFLVLNGFKKNKVLINDPASGPRTITTEELDEAFTGVVMGFKKGPEFTPAGDPPRLLPALGRRLKGSHVALAFVLLTGLALVLPGLVAPVFSKVFVDVVLLRGHDVWLKPLLLGLGLTAAMVGALTWLQQTYLLRFETRLALSNSSRFLRHVLRLPVEFFNQRFAGEISSRVAINDRIAQILTRDLATHFLGVLMIVFFAVLMFQYDVVLTLVAIFVVSLNAAALRFVARKRTDGSRQLLLEQGKLQGGLIGGLQMIETLKAGAGESDLFSRLSGQQAKIVNIRQRLERYTQFLDAMPPLLTALNTAAILGIGSLRVISGALSLGELVAYQVLVASFVTPIGRLVNLGGKLQTVAGDMSRLDDVLRYPPEVGTGDEPEPLPPPSEPVKLVGHLELREISFGYSRMAPALIEDFNLHIAPGKRIALVGGTGSGKSTIARLVTGLYQPWEGEITFDGKHRDEIPRSVINRSLAVVDQNVFLFEGSIRQNLTLWDDTLPLPEVVAAAKDAAIHEVIAARPGGYDSGVEERGANFSGGQRQRLEIARALAQRPSLLVLDEATSALDPTTEQIIDENIRRRGCACLIVAHRLSTIRDADEIIVLEKGKVVQRGTHDELIEDPEGTYAQLISTY